jgi:enoyl-CoA hydratase/carnithine racemase
MRLERPAPHIAEIVLDRPEALNALSTAMAAELTSVASSLGPDGDVRAVVLSSGTPRCFCVGADLKERAGFCDEELAEQRPVFRPAFASMLGIAVRCVAAVHGPALGGRLEQALCYDLIVADSTALLGLPEVGVGLVPGGGGTQLLQRRVGLSWAPDLLFTGRRVSADEAYRLGIVDRLAVAGSDRDAALGLAAEIAPNAPGALRSAKAALRGGLRLDLSAAPDVEDAAWRQAAFSADRKEGTAAFVEKRSPRWQSG